MLLVPFGVGAFLFSTCLVGIPLGTAVSSLSPKSYVLSKLVALNWLPVCECEPDFISPSDELTACPGCTPPLAHCQLGYAPAPLYRISADRSWMVWIRVVYVSMCASL